MGFPQTREECRQGERFVFGRQNDADSVQQIGSFCKANYSVMLLKAFISTAQPTSGNVHLARLLVLRARADLPNFRKQQPDEANDGRKGSPGALFGAAIQPFDP